MVETWTVYTFFVLLSKRIHVCFWKGYLNVVIERWMRQVEWWKLNAVSWKLKVEIWMLNVECWKKVCELVRLWVWELVSLGVWDSEGVKACCLVGAHTNYIAVQPAGDPVLRQGVLTHDHTWPQEKGGDKLTIFFCNVQFANNEQRYPPFSFGCTNFLTTQFEWFNLMFIIALKSHDVHYCIENVCLLVNESHLEYLL